MNNRWLTISIPLLILIAMLSTSHSSLNTNNVYANKNKITSSHQVNFPFISQKEKLLSEWSKISIPEETLDCDDTATSQSSDLLITSSGTIYIACKNNTGISFQEYRSGFWKKPEQIFTTTKHVNAIEFAKGSDESIYIALQLSDFSLSTQQLYVLKREANEWIPLGNSPDQPSSIHTHYTSGFSFEIDSNGILYIAWVNHIQPHGPVIYVKRWLKNQWQEVGKNSASGAGISHDNIQSWRRLPRIAIDQANNVYIAWTHNYSVTEKNAIFIKKWNGTHWIEVGSGSASTTVGIAPDTRPQSLSLAIDNNRRPYIAWGQYHDASPTAIYVRRWNGSTWEEVGGKSASGQGLSQDLEYGSNQPRLVASPEGIVFLTWVHRRPSSINSLWSSEIYGLYINSTNQWQEMGKGSSSGKGITNLSGLIGPYATKVTDGGKLYVFWDMRYRYEEDPLNEKLYLRYWQP